MDIDLHAGLAGIELAEPQFDLGGGVVLRRTYAHMFAPFMLAFTPAEAGKPTPGPWKAARGGLTFDITAELHIPGVLDERYKSRLDVARAIVFLLRLGVNPSATLPVYSYTPFSALPIAKDDNLVLEPLEVEPRRFPLAVDDGVVSQAAADWVKERWVKTLKLRREHAEFALAVDALDQGQFVSRSELTLVSIWAALEALFSPTTSELRFRVSALIASYLEPAGELRVARQKAISKLYDKRSAAAHGKPTHEAQHLLDSFNLLREVLTRMLDVGYVPTKEQLENGLFGA